MTAPVFDIADAISSAVASALPPSADAGVATDVGATTPTTIIPPKPGATEPVADEADADAKANENATDDAAKSGADDEQTDATTDEETAAADEALDLPDGLVVVPSVTDNLATEFTLKDEHGEVEIPSLIVEYKANGKVRQDRLDQVVKLAQWGVYSQDREQRLKQETQQQVEQVQQLLAEREAQMERLLTDEEFRDRVYEAYLNENSPERRAERAEQEVQNLRVSQELQSIQQSGEQFYAAEIEPAIRLLTDALPSIAPEELESRLEMAMRAHVEVAPNGQPYVPPSRYDAIRQYIVEDLVFWAQTAHARRHQPATAATKQTDAELERARVSAQKAKREIGRTLKPVGQVGQTADRTKRAAAPSTVDDAVQAALTTAMASFRS